MPFSKVGTCHFVSRSAACRYYSDYGYDDIVATIQRKIEEGEIKIGPPELGPNQSLSLIDNNTRYAIVERGQRPK